MSGAKLVAVGGIACVVFGLLLLSLELGGLLVLELAVRRKRKKMK